MTQLVSQTHQAARKDHRCDDCGQVIERGELYYRSAVAGEGRVWTWREHDECSLDASEMLSKNWFDDDDWPSEWSFREMQDDLRRERIRRIADPSVPLHEALGR